MATSVKEIIKKYGNDVTRLMDILIDSNSLFIIIFKQIRVEIQITIEYQTIGRIISISPTPRRTMMVMELIILMNG